MCSRACSFFDLRSFCPGLVPPAHICCSFQLCLLMLSVLSGTGGCSFPLFNFLINYTISLSWRNHVSFHWMNKLLCCWRTYDVRWMIIVAYALELLVLDPVTEHIQNKKRGYSVSLPVLSLCGRSGAHRTS